MLNIEEILEEDWIRKYLEKRWLLSSYKNNKNKLLVWYLWKLDFKLRQPKWTWIYSFRINKKYRAFWYFRGSIFIVVEINDHQN